MAATTDIIEALESQFNHHSKFHQKAGELTLGGLSASMIKDASDFGTKVENERQGAGSRSDSSQLKSTIKQNF